MKKLFCIPCGGTSAVLFTEWKKYFKNHIELITLEIPGRGSKSELEMKQDIPAIAEELSHEIEQQADGKPYSILGLCFGALIGYEICRIFSQTQKLLPEHLYICGSTSPEPLDKSMYTPFFTRAECRTEIGGMFRRLFPPQLFPDEILAEQLAQQMVRIFYTKLDAISLNEHTSPSELMLCYDDVSALISDAVDRNMMEYMIDFANSLIASVTNDELASLRYYHSEKSKEKSTVPAIIIYGKQDTILGDSWQEWNNWITLEKSVGIEEGHFTLMWAAEKISAVILESEADYV